MIRSVLGVKGERRCRNSAKQSSPILAIIISRSPFKSNCLPQNRTFTRLLTDLPVEIWSRTRCKQFQRGDIKCPAGLNWGDARGYRFLPTKLPSNAAWKHVNSKITLEKKPFLKGESPTKRMGKKCPLPPPSMYLHEINKKKYRKKATDISSVESASKERGLVLRGREHLQAGRGR